MWRPALEGVYTGLLTTTTGLFTVAKLAPFRPAQVRDFVRRWYAHAHNRRGSQDNSAALIRAIETRPHIAKLTGSPLLLTLMSALHASRRASLPEDRHELCARTVDLLMDSWLKAAPTAGEDVAQSLVERHHINLQRLLSCLATVAFDAHRRQTPGEERAADIPESDLVTALTDLCREKHNLSVTDLIEHHLADRAGILIDNGNKTYAFPTGPFRSTSPPDTLPGRNRSGCWNFSRGSPMTTGARSRSCPSR